MPDEPAAEGQPGVNRVEAFSDGVIAIIITIMVLELKAPEEPGWAALARLWPLAVAYVLSFAYVGIYWVNHHRLFSHARVVTNGLVWLNLGLLFALSLVPFATAYLGEQHFDRGSTLLYLGTMLLPALFYSPLQRVIHASGSRSESAETYHRQTIRKGVAAATIYAAGIPLTLASPWLGIAAAVLVAILWFLPRGPLDLLFEDKAHKPGAKR